ncbi:MAG: GUN4 domain-containing protein [Cylindrospermopsis raciborskii KL1]|uniref:GUN4 domain-containing protein n=1 Tax=Cylindrospermopsis raciborskii TaxID=77022 RepID=UPI001A1D905E|nr:GUN4 domain-containing protein [Cylindrospermopsis raciborskii]MBG0744884.1 GUN4 domain-containing protein [Cylindrospermopsis raciborskii KL1]
MNDLPRQKLKEIIVQHGRALCDDPKRCEAFLRDYCGQYGREIFILISALKKGVAKDILSSSNIPVELLLGRLTKQMQNDLGLTEEAARYAVESWAMVLDKMTPQQIQQPIIKPPTTISRNQQPILESTHPQPREISQTRQKPIIKPPKRSFLKTAGIAIGGLVLVLMTQQIFGNQEATPIQYTELETLLKAQDFRAADEETTRVMLAVANRENEGWLRTEDAEKFPCKELRSIDKLWLKYSGGKFGISVQQQIYQSLGGTKEFNSDVWESMGDRVGWRQGGQYSDLLNFTLSAPSGHLPVRLGWGGLVRVFRVDGLVVYRGTSLLSRYAECNT